MLRPITLLSIETFLENVENVVAQNATMCIPCKKQIVAHVQLAFQNDLGKI